MAVVINFFFSNISKCTVKRRRTVVADVPGDVVLAITVVEESLVELFILLRLLRDIE